MDAVNRAKSSLGDLVITATVTKVTDKSFNTTTLKPDESTKVFDVQGFYGDWTEGLIKDRSIRDTLNVRMDDVQFFMFPADVDVTNEDTVVVDGVTYTVKGVLPYKVGSSVAMTMLQLRR